MRRYSTTFTGPPADAERYQTIAWVTATVYRQALGADKLQPRGVHVRVWRGKALKPFANYLLPDAAAAAAYIERCKRDEDARIDRVQRRGADRKERTAQAAREIQVGTILHYSWGYEQTQCEFFEVVERKGLNVVIREIAAASVPNENAEQYMADRRCPQPGTFIGEPIRKRITAGGISMEFGTARVVHPWETHHCSWYG